MQQEEINRLMQEELSNNEDSYTFPQKVESLLYHVGMVLFGKILNHEKYDNYMKSFEALKVAKGIKRSEQERE